MTRNQTQLLDHICIDLERVVLMDPSTKAAAAAVSATTVADRAALAAVERARASSDRALLDAQAASRTAVAAKDAIEGEDGPARDTLEAAAASAAAASKAAGEVADTAAEVVVAVDADRIKTLNATVAAMETFRDSKPTPRNEDADVLELLVRAEYLLGLIQALAK